ncbi:MAG: HemK/PrmC family methyltransferase [Polyangia bacterium]
MSAMFMGLPIETAPDVLVPRAETELLCHEALRRVDEAHARIVVDLCCGSGNLACALATLRPSLQVWASDLTDACVALARRNVERCGLAARVTVVKGDLMASLQHLAGTVDVLVCNPPYISTGRLVAESAHLLESEPREAFDGGPYGLTIHQRVVRESPPLLTETGWLAFEMGLGQERQLELVFQRAKTFGPRTLVNDAAGAPRVVSAQRIPR